MHRSAEMKKAQSNGAVVSFGEIMGRIDFPGETRIQQGLPGETHFTFAGAEANTAVSISMLGGTARFVTALPDNDITHACIRELKGWGVDTEYIIHGPGRLGLYFSEKGANQRPGKVVYDREYSAISTAHYSDFHWSEIFKNASWLHISGITPALSKQSFENSVKLCKAAREANLRVSCDLNFRRKLWNWEQGTSSKKLAQRCMPYLLENVDIVLANEEDSADVLGIEADGSNVESGTISMTGYEGVAKEIVARFPKVEMVAITLRESISASSNNWGAMLYCASCEKSRHAPSDEIGRYRPYEINSIVDRIGGGDSFAAGLIFALNSGDYSNSDALRFAVAASCLCHSIRGDFNVTSRSEVEALMNGNASGRVQR